MNDFIARSMSYPGIFLLMLLENIFPPLPSELVMAHAGYEAGKGGLNFWLAVLVGALGSLAGQLPVFYLARGVGKRRLKRWADRYGAWLTVTGEDIERADGWFRSFGSRAVLAGRLVPGVRSVIALPAGFSDMAPWKFLVLSALGTSAWSYVPAYFGSVLGENYQRVGHVMGIVTWVGIAGMAAGFAAFVIRRRSRRTTTSRGETQQTPPEGGRARSD